MPVTEKEFVLKHIFKNVSSMKEGDDQYSEVKEHFGVPWKLDVTRKNEHLGMYLHCELERDEDKKRSIETNYDMKISSATGKSQSDSCERTFTNINNKTGWGFLKFIKWDELMEDYVIRDQVIVEVHVKIKKMTGIEKEKLRNFDESAKEYSDVVLVVEDEKFYVSKLFLAYQSSYFKSLLIGNFGESKQSEITLEGIKAKDFQNFLEILHGEPAIDDETVDGILHLADMYDTRTVIRLCEEFLIEKSEKSTKEKLELATKYNFEGLKNKCLKGIKTIDDIRSVLDYDMSQMDHSVVVSLLQKSVSFQK